MTTGTEVDVLIDRSLSESPTMLMNIIPMPTFARSAKLVAGQTDTAIATERIYRSLDESGFDPMVLLGSDRLFRRIIPNTSDDPQNTDVYNIYNLAPMTSITAAAISISGRIMAGPGRATWAAEHAFVIAIDNPTLPELRAVSKYVMKAVADFGRLNAQILEASPFALECVIRIINHSVERGYRPVATLDEDDNSMEIEARLDPNRLLLLQAWASGYAEGIIFSDLEGFKTIEARTVGEILEWIVASETQGETRPSSLRQ